MSPVLLLLGAALLAWPSGAAARSRRLTAPGQNRARPDLRALAGGPGGPWACALASGGAAVLLSTPVVAALAAVCGAVAGRALQMRGRTAAADRRTRALVEALGVLAAEVRAGRPLREAAEAAVGGCPDPGTARALEPVLRLAAPPAVPADDESSHALVRIAAAVRLSTRTGCSLAGVVAAVEDDLRARLRAGEELRSAVAGPRASATVLAGLPLLGLLMGSGVGADPWRVLTTTAAGTALLVLGVALELAGLTWSARLVRRAVAR
ncbi:type II secretion system F family protein [Modestobacter sp. VKM Ac-2984]|uniref:type II secretion system F family protein n=1 Tax=Modestobacter sp. VKM Ac-2984 TaxID=3004138 RepID=UPI0022A9FB12|nr:pilus assembly protein TadB [Modestobacter sp. VKM Ac-2984]MCZ2817564.1 pilus assembly protein TadB [Modestobacter sp. VKM Ac-2984]